MQSLAIHNESVWWVPVFMSVPSWQYVVCIPGSVWGAGWGNYCSSHSVRCGPYFLGGSGTAERARPGPLNDYWAPSWEYVSEEDRVKKYVRYNQVCFTTASSNKLLVTPITLYVLSKAGLPLPLDPGGEPFSEFFKGAGILAFNLTPSSKVVCQVQQLLAFLLKLQVQNLQLVCKLATHLWKETKKGRKKRTREYD